jgi:hypothetical protein
VAIDDLLSPGYGLTLTYAFHRGFADLGADMTERFLVFLNADFVLADGCYRTLVRHIMGGERLIVAPSYCVVEENVMPLLHGRATAGDGVLAVPPREMAEIIISNRHKTIRAKTVNQRLFSMHRHEQFYWYLDERTMLAHQMPISLVCMKPERPVVGPVNHWDYGITRIACPTANLCVIADSDDFLALELRQRTMLDEYFRAGWPTAREIAADLSSYATADHREHGRHQLVLHSGDLPESTACARHELQAFVDDVYSHLSQNPHDYEDHRSWRHAAQRFRLAQAQRRKRLTNASSGVAESGSGSDREGVTHSFRGHASLPNDNGIAARHGLDQAGAQPLFRLYDRLVGGGAAVGRLHPNWLDFHNAKCALERVEDRGFERMLIVQSNGVQLTSRLAPVEKRRVIVRVSRLGDPDAPALRAESGPFDFCVFDLRLGDLLEFDGIYKAVRPHLGRGTKVIIFCLNRPVQRVSQHDLLDRAFPAVDTGTLRFSGSQVRAWALRRLFGAAELAGRPWYGSIAAALQLAGALPVAFVANAVERHRPPRALPIACTSLIIEFDVT